MTFDEHPATSDAEREALEFLRKGRKLRGLSPMQLQRIEHRLAHPRRAPRRRFWLPALAALGLVLLVGTAVAHVVDFSRLPFVGSLFPSREPSPALKTQRPRSKASAVPPPSADVSTTRAPTPRPPMLAPTSGSTQTPQSPRALGSSSALPTRAARSGSAVARSLVSPRGLERAAEPKGRGTMREAEPGTPSVRAVRAAENVMAEPTWVRAPTIAAQARVSSGIAPAGAADDPISAESRSFSAAVARWHRDHDAEAALAALDVHERRFPRGQMHLEARLLRAEIFLQQGREREALTLLDGVSLPGLPRGRELQTVRGELRIKHGRCAEGRSDLEHVLAKARADALGRRAARAILLCP
jgi:hypothetical protein